MDLFKTCQLQRFLRASSSVCASLVKSSRDALLCIVERCTSRATEYRKYGQVVEDEQDSSVCGVGFTDLNQWPVLEAQVYQHNLWIEAPTMHQFCLDNGVYRYCGWLIAMWDLRAAMAMDHSSSSGIRMKAILTVTTIQNTCVVNILLLLQLSASVLAKII